MDKALGGRSPTPDKRYPEGTATPPTLKELGISKRRSPGVAAMAAVTVVAGTGTVLTPCALDGITAIGGIAIIFT